MTTSEDYARDYEESSMNSVTNFEAKEDEQLEILGVESDLELPPKKDSGVDPSLCRGSQEHWTVQEGAGSKKKPYDTSDCENVDAFRRNQSIQHLKKESDQDLEMNNGEWTFLDQVPDIMECSICCNVF